MTGEPLTVAFVKVGDEILQVIPERIQIAFFLGGQLVELGGEGEQLLASGHGDSGEWVGWWCSGSDRKPQQLAQLLVDLGQ